MIQQEHQLASKLISQEQDQPPQPSDQPQQERNSSVSWASTVYSETETWHQHGCHKHEMHIIVTLLIKAHNL